jgi:hypothetical protein
MNMDRVAWAFGLAIAIVLAGCSNPSEPPGEGPTSTNTPSHSASQSTTSASGSTTSGPPAPAAENLFEWTACEGLGIGVDMATPLFDAPRPTGWSASTDTNAALGVLGYDILRCERVSWGVFERGPIYIMREDHNDFEPAGDCGEGDFTQGLVLSAIWFSDAEIAQYAHDRFGMPAQTAVIEIAITPAPAGQQVRATWSLPGGQVSEANFYDDQQFDSTFNPNWRVFWGAGPGVGYLDLSMTYHTPQESPGVAYGTLASPMLYGMSMPDPTFVTFGQTDSIHQGTASGEISMFSDSECTKPL